jgi:hypothetical protein
LLGRRFDQANSVEEAEESGEEVLDVWHNSEARRKRPQFFYFFRHNPLEKARFTKGNEGAGLFMEQGYPFSDFLQSIVDMNCRPSSENGRASR